MPETTLEHSSTRSSSRSGPQPSAQDSAPRTRLVVRLMFLVPLLMFLAMVGYFWIGLGRDPQVVPSVLINQTVPNFSLAAIEGRDQGLNSDDLKGQVSLVNIFGSWCVACQYEHPVLMELATRGDVPIYGIDWREPDRSAGPAWLARHGDPYTLIGDDPDSKAAIAFGVTGAPETFIVDADGVIRFKHAGPITIDLWNTTLWPIIERLRAG